MMHAQCFIARGALWEQAWFELCLLRTRKTFSGELFGLGLWGALLAIIHSLIKIPLTAVYETWIMDDGSQEQPF